MVNSCEKGKSCKYCKDFILISILTFIMLLSSVYLTYFKTDKLTKFTPAMKYVPLQFRNITRIKTPGRLGNKADKVTEYTPAMKYVPLHFRNITRIKTHGCLGNKMFQYATLLGIAKQNNMTVILPPNYQSLFGMLQQTFNLSNHPIVPLNIITKTYSTFREFFHCGYYDNRTLDFSKGSTHNKNVILHGYYQSFKYFDIIKEEIARVFAFKPTIAKKIEVFLKKDLSPSEECKTMEPGFTTCNMSSNLSKNVTSIGIHVRRGDFLKDRKSGFVVAPREYFLSAMKVMKEKYGPVHFFVASEDIKWCKAALNRTGADVTYSRGMSPAEDMALVTLCDHRIISSGTFSWWCGWLGKGTTIYYEEYPKPNTSLSRHFRKEDYYPSHWIPMS